MGLDESATTPAQHGDVQADPITGVDEGGDTFEKYVDTGGDEGGDDE